MIYRRDTPKKIRVLINNTIRLCDERGDCIFDEWLSDRQSFADYLTTLTGWDTPGFWLTRIDNVLPYEPGNLVFMDCSSLQDANKHQPKHIPGGQVEHEADIELTQPMSPLAQHLRNLIQS